MARKEHPSSPNGKWFRKLFKRDDNAAFVEERVEGSLEAASVSDNADKLLEAPREMVLPTLNPREHISVEGVEPPSAEVLETAVEPTWRDKLKLRNRKSTESLSDSFATADMVVQRPIRLFIGYVPDVTEKDAKFFAMGVAEKNVDSEYISYMGLFKYGTGYAYEIQEGGHGHSYLTRILKYFSQLPPGLHDAETAVYVATASRMVQVEKTADGGLVCIQLPESYKAKETEASPGPEQRTDDGIWCVSRGLSSRADRRLSYAVCSPRESRSSGVVRHSDPSGVARISMGLPD
jgi:hypothetical protein